MHPEHALSPDPHAAIYDAQKTQNENMRAVWNQLTEDEKQFAIGEYPFLKRRLYSDGYWNVDFRGVIAMLFPRFTDVIDESETGLLPTLTGLLHVRVRDDHCPWMKGEACPGDLVFAVLLISGLHSTDKTSPCSLRAYIPDGSLKVQTQEWLTRKASVKDVMDLFRGVARGTECAYRVGKVLRAIDDMRADRILEGFERTDRRSIVEKSSSGDAPAPCSAALVEDQCKYAFELAPGIFHGESNSLEFRGSIALMFPDIEERVKLFDVPDDELMRTLPGILAELLGKRTDRAYWMRVGAKCPSNLAVAVYMKAVNGGGGAGEVEKASDMEALIPPSKPEMAEIVAWLKKATLHDFVNLFPSGPYACSARVTMTLNAIEDRIKKSILNQLSRAERTIVTRLIEAFGKDYHMTLLKLRCLVAIAIPGKTESMLRVVIGYTMIDAIFDALIAVVNLVASQDCFMDADQPCRSNLGLIIWADYAGGDSPEVAGQVEAPRDVATLEAMLNMEAEIAGSSVDENKTPPHNILRTAESASAHSPWGMVDSNSVWAGVMDD